jgi:outer membrane protein assembly factor BamA
VHGGPSVAEVYGLDETEIPGFVRGRRIVHAGAGLGVDLRNRERDGSGFSFFADAAFAQGIAGDPSQHARLSVETVAAVGGSDKQLLFRGHAVTMEQLGWAAIPFDELFFPSGRFDMRGFADGRFRGQSGLVGTLEYRWYISTYLDASLFTDVGTVAGPRFAGLDARHWFPSYGVGLRYYSPSGAYWEARPETGVQVAYAPDGGIRLLLRVAAF